MSYDPSKIVNELKKRNQNARIDLSVLSAGLAEAVAHGNSYEMYEASANAHWVSEGICSREQIIEVLEESDNINDATAKLKELFEVNNEVATKEHIVETLAALLTANS